MRICIYCLIEKEDSEFSLEHVIPRSLGGAYAPDQFKTRSVCKSCNNNLGLFVDAAFEKSFLVHNYLISSAETLFDPNKPTGIPLRCMGDSDLKPPEMTEREVCEHWIGPLGEQIYWIRPKDENLYWHTGGNPRTTKSVKTKAYFLFSILSKKKPLITWLSFKDAFEGKRVDKIMCTNIVGSDPKTIGFKEPDEIDKIRIEFFLHNATKGEERKNRISYYTNFDLRFLAKLSIGVSFCLFGEKILNSAYIEELNEVLYSKHDNIDKSEKRCFNIQNTDDFLKDYLGVKHGVTITILPFKEGVAINLNINKQLNWTALCADSSELEVSDLESLRDGICIVLFKSLQKSIRLSLLELTAHNTGSVNNKELLEIEDFSNRQLKYLYDLRKGKI